MKVYLKSNDNKFVIEHSGMLSLSGLKENAKDFGDVPISEFKGIKSNLEIELGQDLETDFNK